MVMIVIEMKGGCIEKIFFCIEEIVFSHIFLFFVALSIYNFVASRDKVVIEIVKSC